MIQNDCSPVIKNVDFEAKEIIQSSEEKISETKKLSIYKDKEYKDSGVRFIIENIPEEADTLQVFLKKNDVEEQISWIGEKIHSKLFHSGFYEYEFLLAGKEYEFIFIYSSEKKGACKILYKGCS